jgi:hypothetical protein
MKKIADALRLTGHGRDDLLTAGQGGEVTAPPHTVRSGDLVDVAGRAERHRLMGLEVAAFTNSFDRLTEPAQETFTLLGLHPGPDLDAPAAAALIGRPVGETRQLLEELLDARLLEQYVSGRYTFTDLLRAHAVEQVARRTTEAVRGVAISRMVRYYRHCAHDAGLLTYPTDPGWPRLEPPEPHPDITPVIFTDRAQALTWYEHEHSVLAAVVTTAAAAGLNTEARQLASALVGYLREAGR